MEFLQGLIMGLIIAIAYFKIFTGESYPHTYEGGRAAALDAIERGEDPRELLTQASRSMTFDDFDRGWIATCKEYLD